MQRLKDLLSEYGPYALGTFLAISLLCMGGFWLAIRLGFQPDGVAANAGALGGAYIANQAIKPLRIMATLALTPVVAKLFRRAQRRAPADGAGPEASPETSQPALASPDA